MEFKARLAGANIKSSSVDSNSDSSEVKQPKPKSLVDKLRQKKQSEMQDAAKSGKKTTFSDGVGYMVI